MGVGRIFSRGGPLGDFFYIFPEGGKSDEIWFLPLKTKKTTFFAENVKIQGDKAPLPPLLTPMASVFKTWSDNGSEN